jgi:hypothetical protein
MKLNFQTNARAKSRTWDLYLIRRRSASCQHTLDRPDSFGFPCGKPHQRKDTAGFVRLANVLCFAFIGMDIGMASAAWTTGLVVRHSAVDACRIPLDDFTL